MSSIVEFVIKMKDLVSGGVQKMGATTTQTFTAINNAIGNTQRRFNTVNSSIGQMSKRLDDLRKTRDISVDTRQIRAANREIQTLERRMDRLQNIGARHGGSAGSGGGSGLLGMVGGMKGLIAGAGITALVAGAGQSAGAAMNAGAQRTSFEVMAGQQQGGALFGDITKFAQQSIFGNELYQNAQTMLSFGASAREIMPDLKMLGGISMGNKEKLGSLSLAYSQIRATGRLMGQDLLQLVNAGFNPLQIISEKTGKSMGALKQMMEEGQIPFSMVKQAFESATGPGGRFFDMTNKIAETPFGKWEALKGQVQGIAVQFGTMMLPALSKVMDLAANLLGYLPQVFTAIQPLFDFIASLPLGEVIQPVVSILKSLFAVLGPVLGELKPLFNTILEVGGMIFRQVATFVGFLMQRLGPTLKNIAHIASVILGPALKIVGVVLGWIIKIITWVIDKIAYVLNFVTGLLSKVADGIGWVMDKAAHIVGYKSQRLVDTMKRTMSDKQIVNFFAKLGETHGQAYVDAVYQRYRAIAVFMDKIYKTNLTGHIDSLRNAYTSRATMATYAQDNPYLQTGKYAKKDEFSFSPGKEKSGRSRGDGINGGGVRSITINLGKFFENIVINASSVSDGIDQAEGKTVEAMLRVLNSANAVQGD